MKVIGSLTRLKCVIKIGFGSTTPKLSSNLHNGPVISQVLKIFSCILQDDNFYKLYVSPLNFLVFRFDKIASRDLHIPKKLQVPFFFVNFEILCI